MKRFLILCFLSAILLFNCITSRQYNFSLKNTLSIFLLNDGKNHYFCIPVQYMGDYQIGNFNFTSGFVTIGEYEILLNKDEINIYAYLNEEGNENGAIGGGSFNLIYSEEKGTVNLSKMREPLSKKNEKEPFNHYYFFIEKFLKNDEYKKIVSEYEKGNVSSRMSIKYDIIINNEEQNENGLLDDFELFNGVANSLAMDAKSFPPNLDFFKVQYLPVKKYLEK